MIGLQFYLAVYNTFSMVKNTKAIENATILIKSNHTDMDKIIKYNICTVYITYITSELFYSINTESEI